MDDGSEIIHIEPDMIPDDVRKNLEAGGILEFKVVNPDENGLIAVTYNMPSKTPMGADREGADEMANDFKDYMSAQNAGTAGPPNDEMSQGTGGGY